MPHSLETATSLINYIFTIYFGLEMGIKLWGLGVGKYVSEGMNLFDGLVTVAGLVEMGLDLSPASG